MICDKCRSEILDGAKFCTVCGATMPDFRGSGEYSSMWAPESPRKDEQLTDDGSGADHEIRAGSFKPRIYVDPYILPQPQPQAEPGFGHAGPFGPYQPPAPEPPRERPLPQGDAAGARAGAEAEMTAGKFFIMELLSLIPFAGLVIMCAWAFTGRANPNRTALAQAKVIMMLINAFVFCVVFVVLLVLVSNNMVTLRWVAFG